MRSCRAKMTFADVTALKDSTAVLVENQYFCDAEVFKEKTVQRDYATLERNQFVLDGTKEMIPEDPEDVAFWSVERSGEDCGFDTVSSTVIQFEEPHSSAGLTLYFAGKYPASVRITWYTLAGTVLHSQIFHPDSDVYVCKSLVQNYGKIIIEALETQFPDSYARMQYILYGLELNWGESVIKKAKITEDSDVTSATLPENTAVIEIVDTKNDFDVENGNGSWKVIQKSQELQLSVLIDGEEKPAGTFYTSDFSFKKNIATFNLVNSVGLLDGQLFYDGKMYVNKKAGELLEEVFSSAGFEKYEISEDVYNTEVSGYLGVLSCRECVKAICFACGAVANDSRSDVLKIYRPDRYVKHTVSTDRKIMGETSVALEKYVSGISIECGRYSLAADTSDLFNDILEKGTSRITFNMPCDPTTITVTGGTLVKASTNYVDIRMNSTGTCTVKGKVYEESTFLYQKNVDLLPAGEKENIKKFGKCTLYNASKLPELAQKLLDYYSLRKILKMRFFAKEERAGEWLNIKNINGTTSYTLMENHSVDLVSGIISTATCRGYNKVVTELLFAGGELYAGGVGLI